MYKLTQINKFIGHGDFCEICMNIIFGFGYQLWASQWVSELSYAKHIVRSESTKENRHVNFALFIWCYAIRLEVLRHMTTIIYLFSYVSIISSFTSTPKNRRKHHELCWAVEMLHQPSTFEHFDCQFLQYHCTQNWWGFRVLWKKEINEHKVQQRRRESVKICMSTFRVRTVDQFLSS